MWEEWDVRRSLFDNHVSDSMEANLEHMWKHFGFYFPEAELLTDPEGLLKYLVRPSKSPSRWRLCLAAAACTRIILSGVVGMQHDTCSFKYELLCIYLGHSAVDLLMVLCMFSALFSVRPLHLCCGNSFASHAGRQTRPGARAVVREGRRRKRAAVPVAARGAAAHVGHRAHQDGLGGQRGRVRGLLQL